MLIEFKVENYKNFEKELNLKLNDVKNYEFNLDAINNGVVKTGLIYGSNSSGKSNLGFAIMDIVATIADKEKSPFVAGTPYLNMNTEKAEKVAKFSYHFKFDSGEVIYKYEKTAHQILTFEELLIDRKSVIQYDHLNNNGYVKLKGAETLNSTLNENAISFVKFIRSNAVLEKNDLVNKVFESMIYFVDRMLLFSSLERNSYQGFKTGNESLGNAIISQGKLEEFQEFLYSIGIINELKPSEIDGEMVILCKFKGGDANFFNIASTGTKSLTLFYYWLLKLNEVSFVYMDEFDAFYHNKLSRFVVKKVMESKCQALLSTHNTSIMTNDLLRADCYFRLEKGKIKSFASLKEKELRKAHNIEKMYRAGSFDE